MVLDRRARTSIQRFLGGDFRLLVGRGGREIRQAKKAPSGL